MKTGTTDLTIDFTDEEYERVCQLAEAQKLSVEELIRKFLETAFAPKSPSEDRPD